MCLTPRPVATGDGALEEGPTTDARWNVMQQTPAGWEAAELVPPSPTSRNCIASLLHGDRPEFFLYACILGHQLRPAAGTHGTDRVLLCGPGRFCDDREARRILLRAGWTHLLRIDPIEAPHLDKSKGKRHALVFTKLRVLELPYSKALLLDLDILPRADVDMSALFRVEAPAAKYHCGHFEGDMPPHGELYTPAMLEPYAWCPNAGVMRLDPLPQLEQRRAQLQSMLADIFSRSGATYLPEQYYLADRLSGWRHIDELWNMEVWPQHMDPGRTHPLLEARLETLMWDAEIGDGTVEKVLQSTHVWHFSGVHDTNPWKFLDCSGPADTFRLASLVFKARDPSGIVATAIVEWRTALDSAMARLDSGLLKAAVQELAGLAVKSRRWPCDACGELRCTVRALHDLPSEGVFCSEPWSELQWACSDCIVAKLHAGEGEECACASRRGVKRRKRRRFCPRPPPATPERRQLPHPIGVDSPRGDGLPMDLLP